MCTLQHFSDSQSARAWYLVPRWHRPQPPMRHCAGRWAVVRWLASEGHRTQSAPRVESAVAHDPGLGWDVGRAHGAWGLEWPPLDPSGPTIAASKTAPICLRLMLRVFE